MMLPTEKKTRPKYTRKTPLSCPPRRERAYAASHRTKFHPNYQRSWYLGYYYDLTIDLYAHYPGRAL